MAALNSLGVPVDTTLPTEEATSFVLWGPPGAGKSIEAARLGSRILYVQTNPDALRMPFDLHKRGLFPAPPAHRVTIDERYLAATGLRFYYAAIPDLINRFVVTCEQGTNEYDGIIFDEWSTILERVYAELEADPWGISRARKDPNVINPFEVMGNFRQFHSRCLAIGRRSRKLVGFVSHYQLPAYHDDGPFKGSVKVPGGPKVPVTVKDELVKICSEFSAVIEMNVQGTSSFALPLPPPTPGAPPASGAAPAPGASPTPLPPPATTSSVADSGSPRVLRTTLTTDWFRKIRGYGIKAEEPVTMGKYGLREILEAAGFPLPKV